MMNDITLEQAKELLKTPFEDMNAEQMRDSLTFFTEQALKNPNVSESEKKVILYKTGVAMEALTRLSNHGTQ